MARSTTFIGLTQRAYEFLDENAATEKVEVYVDGKLQETYDKMKIVDGKYFYIDVFNPYSHEVMLPGYVLKDGRTVYEIEAADIWSSGPNIFTNLVDENGNPIDPSLDWTEEEMYKEI
jgi:hypothetical protein